MRTGGWLGRPHRRAHASGGKTSWVVPRATTAFFFLAFIVFTCVEPYLGQVNNPNENTRTYLTMAIVEHHTFHLDEIVDRHGWVGDLGRAREKSEIETPGAEQARPHAKRTFTDGRLAQNVAEGKFYMSVKAPATSYFGVPVYWAFMKLAPHLGHKVPTAASPVAARTWWLRAATFTLRLFTVQLPCFFFLVWFERWLRRSTDDIVLRLAAVTAVGFGSNFLAYALMYVSHATSAVAAFLAFGIIMRTRLDSLGDARRRGVGTAFVVGLLVGMIPLLEYTGLPLAAVLAVYGLATFWRPKQLALFALGGVIDVLGLTFYQARACESWKSPCPKLAEGYAWLHTKTFGFGKPSWSFLKDASFSHSSGFFGMSPFMWLGLLAIPFGLFAVFGTPTEKRERRLATAVWLTSMVLLWVFVSAASNPHGGWSVGPRYLGPASPFFAFGAVLALEHIARRGRPWRVVARAAAGGLAIAGAAQVGLVSLVYNTVSDTTQRPLANLALPLARAGFVPHHAAELVGWATPTFWYVVAACLLGGAILAAAWPARDTAWSWSVRFAGVIGFATLGLAPAFSPLSPTLPNDVHFPPYLANLWEPPGRDRITKLREAAERLKPARPCVWHTIADLERDLSMINEANRDDQRAELPRSQCK
jgi:hypothetical protein